MFEEEYNPFTTEDGSVRGKGRKRTRLSSSWRYQSRSPSPQAEHEDTRDTSPESESEPQPAIVMTDEGSQTVGLDDGGAAEVLADFHKQASNVGSSSYGVGAQGQEEPASEDRVETLDVPMIEAPAETKEISKAPVTAFQTPQKMPMSPRLQPIPSDNLPLVSPLVTTKYGALFGTAATQGITGQIPTFTEQPPTPVQESVPLTEGTTEDIYGVSPAAVHGQASGDQSFSFQDPSAGFNALEQASNMQDQFAPENQYGQWQAANEQFASGGTQHASVGEIHAEEPEDGFYEQEQQDENDVQTDGFAMAGYGQPSNHQYPDPEDAMGQSWGAATNYPELSQSNDELGHGNDDVQQDLLPGIFPMSRSHSAPSDAANTVDLTSDSDEGEQSDIKYGSTNQPTVEEEDFDDMDDAEDEVDDRELQDRNQLLHPGQGDGDRSLKEEESGEEEEGSIEYDRRIQSERHYDDEEDSQDSQDEEASYEEIYADESGEDREGQYSPEYPSGFVPDNGQDYYDDDEGSYDDEMEEEGQALGPPSAPVVIDLLSSDDEDDAPPQQAFNTDARPDEGDFGDEEEDEDMAEEQNMAPPLEGAFRQTSEELEDLETHQRSDELDENMADVPEDGDLLDREDGHELSDRELSDDDNFIEKSSEVQTVPKSVAADNAEAVNEVLDSGSSPRELEELILIEGAAAQIVDVVEAEQSDEAPEEMAVDEAEPATAEGDFSNDGDNGRISQENLEVAEAAEGEEEPGTLSVEEPEAHVEMHSPPPRPRSLFEQVFNFDGANDERKSTLSRSKIQAVTSKSDTIYSKRIQPTDRTEKSSKQINSQLPTPEDTQQSLLKEASDLSITSVTEQPVEVGVIIEARKTRSRTRQQTGSAEPVAQEEPADVVHDLRSRTRKQTSVEPAGEEAEEIGHDLRSRTQKTGSIEPIVEEAPGVKHDLRSRTQHQTSSVEPAADKDATEVVHDLRSRTRQHNGSPEPVTHDEAAEDTQDTPRRSHRRGKSASSSGEAPQTKVPSTPQSKDKPAQDEPASAQTDRSMPVIKDEHATPKGHDASVELAMSGLDSAVEQPHDLRSNTPGGPAKLKLNRVLRTQLTEFTSLKLVRYHLTKKLDVLAVVTSTPAEPERAKGGPRHYQFTFNVTDQSIAPTAVTEIKVRRPYKDALPVVKVGDRILLRQFEVTSSKNRGFTLVSTDTSSWAIFTGVGDRVDVRGPPVEYGDGELEHIAGLRAWYDQLEPAAIEKIQKANGK
jgi:hypothetical protein